MDDDELVRIAEERLAKYEWAAEEGDHAFTATVYGELDAFVVKVDKVGREVRLPSTMEFPGGEQGRKARSRFFKTAARMAICEERPHVPPDVEVLLMFDSSFVHAELDRRRDVEG